MKIGEWKFFFCYILALENCLLLFSMSVHFVDARTALSYKVFCLKRQFILLLEVIGTVQSEIKDILKYIII